MELRNKILNINNKDSIELAKIIKIHSIVSNESEMEFDLKKIPDKTLREIQEYVDVCFIKEKDDLMKNSNKTSKKTDKQIKEIKANNLNNKLIYKEKTLDVNFVNKINRIYKSLFRIQRIPYWEIKGKIAFWRNLVICQRA